MAYLSKNQSVFYRISLDNNNYKELSQIFSGNITPIGWYKEFTTKKGTADLALISVLSVYVLYNSTIIFYFMMYSIIISIFNILHFLKVFRDMIYDTLNDVVYVKIKQENEN